MMWVSLVICGVIMGLVMSEYTRAWSRRFPWSYLLVFTFSTFESFLFAYMCSSYPTINVLSSVGLTLLVTLAINLVSCILGSIYRPLVGVISMLLVIVASVVTARFYIEFTESWHPIVIGLSVALWGLFLSCDVPSVQRKHEVYYG